MNKFHVPEDAVEDLIADLIDLADERQEIADSPLGEESDYHAALCLRQAINLIRQQAAARIEAEAQRDRLAEALREAMQRFNLMVAVSGHFKEIGGANPSVGYDECKRALAAIDTEM